MTRFKKNMRRFVVAAVVGAMAMSMTACTSHMFDEKTITGTIKDNADNYTKVQKEFEEYLHDEYVDSVTSDTLSYNYEIKDGDALGIPEPEASLGDSDMSDEGIKKRKAEFDESFDKLKSFDRDDLTESQQLTYDILNQYLETESEGYLNIYLSEPFSPMKGLQSNISTYFTDYCFDDKGDVERYLQVLGMVRDYFDDNLEFEKTKSEKGYFMSDDDALAPADAASMSLLKEQLADVLKTLTPREAKVLSLRFGLDDGNPKTLEEVGKVFNVTRERIRQIEAKALRKLRHPSRSKKLKDFLD